MRTTRPSSTAGSRASCWALLKRCTSSMKRMVPCPCSPRRCRASSNTRRTSATPALTADRGTKALAVTAATTCASVVFPVPGGPHKMAEVKRSCSMRARNGASWGHQMALPGDSSRVRGRRRDGQRAPASRGARPPACGEEVGGARARRRRAAGPRLVPRRGVAQSPAGAHPQAELAQARVGDSALGAPVMGSVPDCVFGIGDDLAEVLLPGQQRHQAVHARRRSRHGAGRRSGRPRAGTRSGRRPPRARCPSASNTLRWMSSRWMRIDPDPSSQPLSTRS